MRALAAFAIALLGPLVVTEGSPLLDALDERIVGGKEVAANSIPWQVALVKYRTQRDPYTGRLVQYTSLFCGGTILCSKYIMTAAHCTVDKNGNTIPAGSFVVMAGEHRSDQIDGTESEHKVRRIINHPSYKDAPKGYDFSILELATPIDLSSNSAARPACLPSSRDTEFNRDTRIGGTNDGPLLPDGKNDGPLDERHLDVGQSKHRNCVSSSVPFHSSHKSANKWGETDCMGDSGGPLTWKKTPTSRTKLVGVVSFGSPNCGIPNAPTVFGKVTAVLPWIQRTTGGCSRFYTYTCGIVPAPRPLGQACDLDDTLRRYGHQDSFMGKTEEANWFNSAANRNFKVILKCDWSLKCQLVSGGWSRGRTTCEKICGRKRC